MAMLHGGEEDTPMLGFPTLDEVDIKTVHEAYQFLSAQYVDEVMKATSTFQLLHRSFMNIARPKIEKPKVDLFVAGWVNAYFVDFLTNVVHAIKWSVVLIF